MKDAAIKDGGSAFPREGGFNYQGQKVVTASEGMTLRDWFAGMVLTSIGIANIESLKHGGESIGNAEATAKIAYAFADAMIEEREKHG